MKDRKVPSYRRGALEPTTVAKIAAIARLRAAGLSWIAVARELGMGQASAREITRRFRAEWDIAYTAAMEKRVEEIRRLAGTDFVLTSPGEFVASAEAADSWLKERGQRLFPLLPPEIPAADPGSHTLASFFEAYYLPQILFDASPKTVELYRICITKFQYLAGNVKLKEIDNAVLGRFRDALMRQTRQSGRRLSKHTVRMYLRHVMHLLAKAGPPSPKNRNAAGYIPSVPFAKAPRCELPTPRIVSFDALAACYRAAGAMAWPAMDGLPASRWWRALLVLAFNTGLRRRTLFALRWEHVSLEESLLRIPAELLKGRRRLVLPLNEITVAHLRSIRGDHRTVFPWPYSAEWFSTKFRELQVMAGLPASERFGLHNIRKTTATMLWKKDPGAAQLMLGHTLMKITEEHYVSAPAVLVDAVKTIPQPFQVPPRAIEGFDGLDALAWL